MTRPRSLPRPSAAACLADYCASLQWDDLPAEVRARTAELVMDLLGVAVGGSLQPSTAAVRAALPATPLSGPGATIIGANGSADAAWAALANGTAAHALELDDVARVSSLHPGAAVIPSAIAVAEEQGACGAALLTAVVAGYEVAMRVGNALNPAAAYRRGFHPTGVAGVFGAAIAAGRLLGLGPEPLTRALGIAGTMASGSLEYLADGSWTKRLNPGWAAHGGVVAARLAAAGFSGPSTVFEGRFGLLRSHTGSPTREALLAELGQQLEIMRVAVKPYGCCRYNHALIDGMLDLRATHGLRPEAVRAISLGVLSAGAPLVAEPIARKRRPRNVVEAQFSAPFAVALALTRGAAGPDLYTEATIADPTIRSLMARTTCQRDPALDAAYPHRWPAWVQVETRDGKTLAARVEYALGEPENPVPRATLVEKFVSLASRVVEGSLHDHEARARTLAEQILRLEEVPDVRPLVSTLRGAGAKPR